MKFRFPIILVLCVIFPSSCLIFQSCGEEVSTRPILLQATHDGGSNSCGFLFHADSTYEWINGSGLGVASEKGTYTLRDSIITLDRSKIDKSIISKYLLIRKQNTPWGRDETTNYLFQVDKSFKIIKNATPFVVY